MKFRRDEMRPERPPVDMPEYPNLPVRELNAPRLIRKSGGKQKSGNSLKTTAYDITAVRLHMSRVERRLTLNDAAERIGVSMSHLQRAETGRSRISKKMLAKIAQFYGVKTSWLKGTEDKHD